MIYTSKYYRNAVIYGDSSFWPLTSFMFFMMKSSFSAFSGLNLFLFSVYTKLAALKSLSELIELGGVLRYLSANSASLGYLQRFPFHHWIGFSCLGRSASDKYLSISFLFSLELEYFLIFLDAEGWLLSCSKLRTISESDSFCEVCVSGEFSTLSGSLWVGYCLNQLAAYRQFHQNTPRCQHEFLHWVNCQFLW